MQYNETNARISSNSWGAPVKEYDWAAYDVDSFAWDFPDFLIIFSGGNFGKNGDYSLATPGHAKNSLTVGAVTNSPLSFIDSGKNVGLRIVGSEKSYQIFPAALTQGFSDHEFVNFSVSIVDFDSECKTSSKFLENSLVLLRNISFCPFEKALQNLQSFQPYLAFVSSEIGSIVQTPYVYIPVAVLSKEDEKFLRHKIENERALIDFPVKLSSEFNTPRIPSFSSIGPTSDQRIKPDVLAPGMSIISAKSDGNPNSNNCYGGKNV